jgi:hypothetical protein
MWPPLLVDMTYQFPDYESALLSTQSTNKIAFIVFHSVNKLKDKKGEKRWQRMIVSKDSLSVG